MALEPGRVEYLDAHVSFHLNTGVDLVIVTTRFDPEADEILERYARDGHVVRMRGNDESVGARLGRAAELAAVEHAADWFVATAPNEFWWPRGAGLDDVLVAVPPRYGVVQALVRQFRPQPGTDQFAERMTVRDSLVSASAGNEPLLHLLRPVRRLVPGAGVHEGQPLRAWYPIEVLRFPPDPSIHNDGGPAEPLDQAPSDESLAVDERLRDALRTLRDGDGFRRPRNGVSGLSFRSPTIVDDAQYAVECAAIGEVNLDRLDRQIRELEGRIAWLEERFWPRVLRRISRLARIRIRHRG